MLAKFLMDVRFSFVDLETTGLSSDRGDRVCEIAILSTEGDAVTGTLDTLLNPQRRIPPDVQSVHGITDEMVARAPCFVEIARDVERLLHGSVVVAHNAPFDLGFLSAEFGRADIPFPVTHIIDTLKIARNHFDFSSNRLEYLARKINLVVGDNHRAMVDVKLTKAVFEYFIGDLERRGFALAGLDDVIEPQSYSSGTHTPQANRYVAPVSFFQSAIREGRKIEIIYYSPHEHATSTRVIEPIEVQAQGKRDYVVAYCHLRKERRQFRLDRIISARRA